MSVHASLLLILRLAQAPYFSRKKSATLVSQALRKLNIPAYVNERHDICVEQFKVSGSAFKISSNKAYHHGTMLIDADLTILRDLLKVGNANITSKSVASVPSPVRNLEEWSAMIDHDQFVEAVVEAFSEEHSVASKDVTYAGEAELAEVEEIRRGAEELMTWDWQYGQTPEFTIKLSRLFDTATLTANVTAYHGVITECRFETNSCDRRMSNLLRQISDALKGSRYGSFTSLGEIDNVRGKQIVQWLSEAMN